MVSVLTLFGVAHSAQATETCCQCVKGETRMCVKFSDITQCSGYARSTALTQLQSDQSTRSRFDGFTCSGEPLSSAQCQIMAAGTTSGRGGACASAPVSVGPALLTALQPQTTAPAEATPGELPTSGGAVQRPPVIPKLNVPIPGLTFSGMQASEGRTCYPWLSEYIVALYRYMLTICTVIATIMIVYGGFRYILGGATGDIQAGKTIIKDALMGMFVAFGAYVILYTVNPETLKLGGLCVNTVASEDISTGDRAAELMSTTENTDRPTASTDNPSCRGGFAGWYQNLRPPLCADCQPGFGCGARLVLDEACRKIAGTHGDGMPCGGNFGLYMRALTDGCKSKNFAKIDGLGGMTYGIEDYNSWDIPDLLRLFDRADHEAFVRMFQNAGMNEWYRNGQIDSQWFCTTQIQQKGLACHVGLRRALVEAGRYKPFMVAQLKKTWTWYQSRIAASGSFQSPFGKLMMSTIMVNPGRCTIGGLRQRCPGGNENETIECILGQYSVNRGSYTTIRQGAMELIPCRGSPAAAMRRAWSIRKHLTDGGVSRQPGAIPPQTLEAIIERCWADL